MTSVKEGQPGQIKFIMISWIVIGLMCFSVSGGNHVVHAESETPDLAVLGLTEEEMHFIQNHPVVRIGVDPRFVPFEFIDDNGEYNGIAADYLDLISQRTGITWELDTSLSWSESYNKALNKEIDLLPSVGRSAERASHFLFTEPYYTYQRVMVVHNRNQRINQFSDLFDHEVGVQRDSSHHSFLREYPTIRLRFYQTVEEGLAAVNRGDEEVFVGNLATISYLSRSFGFTELKYIPVETGMRQYLHMAVRDDWPELQQILNKTLASITEEERLAIAGRWVALDQQMDYSRIIRLLSMIGAVILLVFIVSFYWIAKLKQEISDKNKAQAALKVAKEEAESAKEAAIEANEVKSLFLARMSHEIRTPLNAITGMAYLLKKTDVTNTQRMHINKIVEAAKSMLSIINDILDFSKIEADKIELEHVSFNLDHVLQNVVNLVSYMAKEKNIEFDMQRDPALPLYFIGDPTRLEQILVNIANNAVKFTSVGGVNLNVRRVTSREDVCYVEFTIHDTGIGMSKEHQEQLFKPFSQADATITRRYGGTGLGLSIVKYMVELLEGEIQVYSALEEGTTFEVTLPLLEDREKAFEEKRKFASVYFSDMRVMVLAKPSKQEKQLMAYLNSLQIAAENYVAPKQVIERLQQEKATTEALLIIDEVTLPEGSVSFVARLRKTVHEKAIPKIMVIIPAGEEELFDELDKAKIDVGIASPIIPSVLFNAIIQVFETKMMDEHHLVMDRQQEQRIEKADFPYHVLVVEDNRTNQTIVTSILEQAGLRVGIAENGKQGVEYFREQGNEVDLVLMDLHMPVMNGLDASALIRQDDEKIPIIAMTADAVTGIQEKCARVGITQYVSKPYDPEELVATVLKTLQSSTVTKKPADQSKSTKHQVEMVENSEMIDEADGLKRIGNNQQLYHMVLSLFVEENVGVDQQLQHQLEAKDVDAAIQTVHKIKSSAGNIGAEPLRRAAVNLQQSLTDGDWDRANSLHNEFQKVFKKTKVAIDARIERGPA